MILGLAESPIRNEEQDDGKQNTQPTVVESVGKPYTERRQEHAGNGHQ